MTDPNAGFTILLQQVAAWHAACQREMEAEKLSETLLANSGALSEAEFAAATLPIERAALIADRAHRMAAATARRLFHANGFRAFLATKTPDCETPDSVVDFLFACIEEGRELYPA